MGLICRHRLTARFRDCDPLGHVNHAVYLTYLEQARFILWRRQLDFVVPTIGGARADREASQPGFILAHAEVDYVSQARYGDELEIRLSLDAIGRTSFTYSYDVVGVPAAQRVATAKTVLVLFDYAQQRPVPIDDDLRVRLARPIVD